MAPLEPWWQKGVIYQIYPRSFQDSNGDGIGDLRGVTSRLDYFHWLGIDILWICPFYPSPMADFGYDVSAYTSVHRLFGTMGDFQELLAEAHRYNIRVLLDFVPNHTSEKHPWFVESRACRQNPRRDWYIWRNPGEDGRPPNNWLANFGGIAWQWEEMTGQYYYHAYLKEQPDLNWRNPQVEAAMFEIMRFWLRQGVDGFRLDALWHLAKDPLLRDNPPNPDFDPKRDPSYAALREVYSCDHEDIHPILRRMRSVVEEFGERVLVGELYLPPQRLVSYYGTRQAPELHLPHNFELIFTDWRPEAVASAVCRLEELLPENAWPTWVLGNHDRPRLASRVGLQQAPVAAMLLLTLRGTPTLYQGDEIGLENVDIPPERIQDPWEKNNPGLGVGRDQVRTPMPWDDSPYAGFTTGQPWLPLNDDWLQCNVAVQQKDSDSLLCLYQRLLHLRRRSPALSIGDWRLVQADSSVLAYLRRHHEERMLVVLNFSGEKQSFHSAQHRGQVILSSGDEDPATSTFEGEPYLRPNEGLIIRCA